MGVYTKYGTCPKCGGQSSKHDADYLWVCNEDDCGWGEGWEEDEDNHDDEMEDEYEKEESN